MRRRIAQGRPYPPDIAGSNAQTVAPRPKPGLAGRANAAFPCVAPYAGLDVIKHTRAMISLTSGFITAQLRCLNPAFRRPNLS